MRKAPHPIPTDASYDDTLQIWQLEMSGRRRFWTRDGRPLADLSVDARGTFDGTSVWHRYPDVPCRHERVPTTADWPGGPSAAYRIEARYASGHRIAINYFDAEGRLPPPRSPRGTHVDGTSPAR